MAPQSLTRTGSKYANDVPPRMFLLSNATCSYWMPFTQQGTLTGIQVSSISARLTYCRVSKEYIANVYKDSEDVLGKWYAVLSPTCQGT